jgi:hypothetical protein
MASRETKPEHSAYAKRNGRPASLGEYYYGWMRVHDREIGRVHSPDARVGGAKPTAERISGE